MLNIDSAPLSKQEIAYKQKEFQESIVDLTEKHDKFKGRVNLFFIMSVIGFAIFATFQVSVFSDSPKNKEHILFFIFILFLLVVYVVLSYIFSLSLKMAKISSFQNAVVEIEKQIDNLNEMDKGCCIQVKEWLKYPKVVEYRDKVVEECRIFTKSEYEMLRSYVVSFEENNACEEVFLSGIIPESRI